MIKFTYKLPDTKEWLNTEFEPLVLLSYVRSISEHSPFMHIYEFCSSVKSDSALVFSDCLVVISVYTTPPTITKSTSIFAAYNSL